MKATTILKHLQDGTLEALEQKVKEEIYRESAKSAGTARQQIAAIKRIAKRGAKLPSRMGYMDDETGAWATDSHVAVHLNKPVPVSKTDNPRVIPLLSRLFLDQDMPCISNPDTVVLTDHAAAEIHTLAKNKNLTGRIVKIGNAHYDAALLSDALYSIMGKSMALVPEESNQVLGLVGDAGKALVMPIRMKDGDIAAYTVA